MEYRKAQVNGWRVQTQRTCQGQLRRLDARIRAAYLDAQIVVHMRSITLSMQLTQMVRLAI